jgi:hypothetical protein
MKNNLITLSLSLVAFCLAACGGCKSLAPGGIYDGDALLYNAEAAVVSSYAVFDTFVKWEYDNRADLEKADASRAAEVKTGRRLRAEKREDRHRFRHRRRGII